MMILKLNELIESSALFKEAFTHSSSGESSNFERLEFLGDSLIASFITQKLFIKYPKASEGDLSRWRSAIVSQETMAAIAMKHNISDHLLSNNPNLQLNQRIKASLVESYFGALYLEFGIEVFEKEAMSLFKSYILGAKKLFLIQDPKTILQEKIQEELKITPVYKLIGKTGKGEGSLSFKVGLFFKEKKMCEATGPSIKIAQKNAAKEMIEKMESY